MIRTIITVSIALAFSTGLTQAATLTVRDCLRSAAEGNHTLKAAAFDERIAADSVTIARSGFLPRVDFQGGYTSQLEPQKVSFIPGRILETQDANFGFFSLSIHQTVYDFGRTGMRTSRAGLLRDAASSDFTAREKDLFLRVVEAYYGILKANSLLLAADDEVTQRQDHLRIAKALYEQGVVTRNDLLQAEVKLADSLQKKLAATNRVNNGWLQLNYLTGAPSDFRAELQQEAPVEPATTETDPVSHAWTHRPEITALNKLVQAGEEEVREADRAFYPEIFAKAGVDYVQNSKAVEQGIFAATLGLRVNLYDGMATSSRKNQALKNLARQNEILRNAREQVRLELLTALNDAGVAAERVKTVGKAIRQGEENLRINRDRYAAQVGTATEVIDAQTLLTQIRTDYYRATFESQVAGARVKRAMGELKY